MPKYRYGAKYQYRMCALLLATAPVSVAAESYTSSAPIAYLLDMQSGAVLHQSRADRRIPPASMTKMMTAYVIFEELEAGRVKLDQKFPVRQKTAEKWAGQGSTMFLKGGEKVTVENLLHGLITVSGNDAAIALAEGVAGSEAQFIDMMNASATKLGMKDSRFGTANGWPDEGKTLTTALDLATLAQRTMADYPSYYRTFYANKTFTWNGITQVDRNPLLGKVAGADGLKTGHTDEAGYCLTGSAEQGGRRLVMVVAGLPTFGSRIKESVRLINWGFSTWQNKPLYKANAIVASAPVQLGSDMSVDLVAPRAVAVSLPKGMASTYNLFIRYTGPIKAPIKKDQRIAVLVTKLKNGSEQITPLVAANDVAEAGYLGRAWNGLRRMVSLG